MGKNHADRETVAQTGLEEQRTTSASQLYNHLYEACNILRGPINQDDYKSYAIPILFFKRISDVYDEETAEAEERYGEDAAFYTEEFPPARIGRTSGRPARTWARPS